MITPTFQAQNPAISGYALGWSSCTAFSAAMAGSFDKQVAKLCTGGRVRTLTHDTSGGLTLAQVDMALLDGWGVNLNTSYRLPWADFKAAIDKGRAGILQGWYAPIADSKYDAGRGFRGNHAITVLPGWVGMDPLADGRAPGVYRFHNEPYPEALLKSFAGKLNIGGSSYQALGSGYVYASLTRDRVTTYQAHVSAGTVYSRYTVGLDSDGHRRIRGHKEYRAATGFTAPCTLPIPVYRQTVDEIVYLVKIQKPGSFLDDVWVSAKYARAM